MQDAKRRAIIFAILSVILAAVAGFMFLQESNALRAGLGEERMVLVAKRDISSREPLRRTDFEVKSVPERYYKPNQVGDLEEIDGNVSIVSITKGDELTSNVLRPITELENSEKRVVELRGSDRVLFDDYFQTQDRVDIIVSYAENGGGSTKFMLKDKLVFRVGSKNSFLGLELSMDEARKLVEAENFAHSIRVIKAPQKQKISDEGAQQQSNNNQTKQQITQGKSNNLKPQQKSKTSPNQGTGKQ
ncbi:SAF domain-containing protein [Marininema halotolerans]|uniref:Flp pilus assembly protein CpaB n=1 Tax=Marininema halotolerans TaxID=1155944 RepID=A0A1I6TA33_9BACL|nr:SAF domain-containing protein [Marininema halotolerans]SFS86030.1 Flp pilus assembly protein CpaB [Marininema halotolerans]